MLSIELSFKPGTGIVKEIACIALCKLLAHLINITLNYHYFYGATLQNVDCI